VTLLIALSGAVTLFFSERRMQSLLLPLVALSAGSLLGSAFLHMLPSAIERMGEPELATTWTAAGLATFFGVEQILHWHRGKGDCSEHHHHPLTYLVLIGDSLHKLVAGLAVGAAFTVSTQVGLVTWLAAAAHEIPHELGDYGALVHGGLAPRRALTLNLLSALPFLIGGLIALMLSHHVHLDLSFLVAFAAGNFIYLGGTDLLPVLNRTRPPATMLLLVSSFFVGMGTLVVLRFWLPEHGH